MGTDGSENDGVIVKVEGKTVFPRDGTFPSVFNPLDFLDPEGWMEHVDEK